MTDLLVPAGPAGSALPLRCTGCGYGVSVRRPPAACPMCRGTSWREERPIGSSLLADELLSLRGRRRPAA